MVTWSIFQLDIYTYLQVLYKTLYSINDNRLVGDLLENKRQPMSLFQLSPCFLFGTYHHLIPVLALKLCPNCLDYHI